MLTHQSKYTHFMHHDSEVFKLYRPSVAPVTNFLAVPYCLNRFDIDSLVHPY